MTKTGFLEMRAKHPNYDYKSYGNWRDIPEEIEVLAEIIYDVKDITINGHKGKDAVAYILKSFAKRLIIQETKLEDLSNETH